MAGLIRIAVDILQTGLEEQQFAVALEGRDFVRIGRVTVEE